MMILDEIKQSLTKNDKHIDLYQIENEQPFTLLQKNTQINNLD
jgi:hypothetical protein